MAGLAVVIRIALLALTVGEPVVVLALVAFEVGVGVARLLRALGRGPVNDGAVTSAAVVVRVAWLAPAADEAVVKLALVALEVGSRVARMLRALSLAPVNREAMPRLAVVVRVAGLAPAVDEAIVFPALRALEVESRIARVVRALVGVPRDGDTRSGAAVVVGVAGLALAVDEAVVVPALRALEIMHGVARVVCALLRVPRGCSTGSSTAVVVRVAGVAPAVAVAAVVGVTLVAEVVRSVADAVARCLGGAASVALTRGAVVVRVALEGGEARARVGRGLGADGTQRSEQACDRPEEKEARQLLSICTTMLCYTNRATDSAVQPVDFGWLSRPSRERGRRLVPLS